jgi:hypothetical protein
MVKDTKGGGKGCINKRPMGRKGMESTKDTTDAMMHTKAKEEEVTLMKVMEGKENYKECLSFFIISLKSNSLQKYELSIIHSY